MTSYEKYINYALNVANGIIADLLSNYEIDEMQCFKADTTLADLVRETLQEIRSYMECYVPDLLTEDIVSYCFESVLECHDLI